MSDFSRDWRASTNVQRLSPDGLRSAWLDEQALAPDDWRAQQGLSPISQATRDSVFRQLASERSLSFDPAFGGFRSPGPRALGPPVDPVAMHPPAGLGSLPPLGEQSFLHRNDAAMSDAAIGGLLAGRPAPNSPFDDALSQVGGMMPLARLGALYGGGR